MIEKEVLQDMRMYKPKVVASFTLRNIVSIIIAAIIGIPAYLFLRDIFVTKVVILLVGVLIVPILLCGFKDLYGLPFGKFAILVFKTKVLLPKKRKYESVNEYYEYLKSINEEEKETVLGVETKKKKKKEKITDPELQAI